MFLMKGELKDSLKSYLLSKEKGSKTCDQMIKFLKNENNKSENTIKKCGNCNKEGSELAPLKLCSICKKTFYCSKECQSSSWKNHKLFCKKN
jgi:hypothetical protein